MVVIRLSRRGAHKSPFYHLMVADSRNPLTGRFLEKVGYFNPLVRAGDQRLKINLERVDHWLSKGARMSPRVAALVKEIKLGSEQSEKLYEYRDRRRQVRKAKSSTAAPDS